MMTPRGPVRNFRHEHISTNDEARQIIDNFKDSFSYFP